MPSASELEAMYLDCYSERRIDERRTDMESSSASLIKQSRFLTQLLRRGDRVLDFGAGTGHLAHLLRTAGAEVDGIEPASQAREAARSRYGFGFYESMDELSVDDMGTYSLIVAMEVLEHLAAPWEALAGFLALLRPGGSAYLTTPNRHGLLARLQKDRWREAAKPFHLVLFNPRSMTRLLRDAGFGDIRPLRFSPLTTPSPVRGLSHRLLQLTGLYGGLRVIARKRGGG